MTRTATADAVLPVCSYAAAACRRAAAAARPAAGIAIASARSLVRPCPGSPHPPRSGCTGLLRRRAPEGNAVMLAGWPADPGRDV
jgi:hypothetical protein